MTEFSWDSVQIYRCTTCGKWSHAKKQPKKHQRTIWEGQPGFDPDLAEPEPWDYDGPLVNYVECGPFTPFIASPGRLA